MSLPSLFDSAADYFGSCVDFLKAHAWIYQHANTCFLQAGVFEHFSTQEKQYFNQVNIEELNAFPFVNKELSKETPISLQEFRRQLNQLIPQEAFQEALACNSKDFSSYRKMSLKKQHEICRLVQIIKDRCIKNELLIDFGAGLGYLSEILYQINEDYRILGLEADPVRVETARRRQATLIPTANQAILYKQHLINEDSAEFIAECIQDIRKEEPEAEPFCTITGLHACADLTVTSMRLFFDMPLVRQLIIMPCCYHKLEMLTEQKFRNFPLSKSLQAVADDGGYFNRPFLRLACQQTLAHWHCCTAQEHDEHGRQMWQRAVAEALLDKSEKVVKRKCKHKVNKAESVLTFSGLCAAYQLKAKLNDESLDWQPHHEQRFNEIRAKYADGAKLSEGLTCLQTTMQKLCENIVLYDRLCYMLEYAASSNIKISARFAKLMNDKISPRCYALIAEKLPI